MRKLVFISLLACMAPAGIAPAQTNEATHLPAGSRVGGVEVGGAGPIAAERALRKELAPRFTKNIAIRIGARARTVPPAAAGASVDYDWMVKRAFEIASRGHVPRVGLDVDISDRKLGRTIDKLSGAYYKAPRDARVKFGITKIRRVRGRVGRRLDSGQLRRKLLAELSEPSAKRSLRIGLRTVKPRVTTAGLARKHPTYISIDKRTFTLRLFKRLRHSKTYKVAVGQAAFDTPGGLRSIQSIQPNPTWNVPSKPWAGALAGQTIPPGDPRNPLKAFFLALGGDGIGIHGTAEEWSIGTRASHGCIRMRVRDVKDLRKRVSVGTPVRVR
ncbi:MAG: L,D-transpeptidase family protein [Thermoleophilaceae bacterium]|nr:L,D-transpeptidase family protein [Thermoleophilaceae bacterium]